MRNHQRELAPRSLYPCSSAQISGHFSLALALALLSLRLGVNSSFRFAFAPFTVVYTHAATSTHPPVRSTQLSKGRA